MILSADELTARYLSCRYDLLELGLLISGGTTFNLIFKSSELQASSSVLRSFHFPALFGGHAVEADGLCRPREVSRCQSERWHQKDTSRRQNQQFGQPMMLGESTLC
jgi:hypothetical protein